MMLGTSALGLAKYIIKSECCDNLTPYFRCTSNFFWIGIIFQRSVSSRIIKVISYFSLASRKWCNWFSSLANVDFQIPRWPRIRNSRRLPPLERTPSHQSSSSNSRCSLPMRPIPVRLLVPWDTLWTPETASLKEEWLTRHRISLILPEPPGTRLHHKWSTPQPEPTLLLIPDCRRVIPWLTTRLWRRQLTKPSPLTIPTIDLCYSFGLELLKTRFLRSGF